MNVHETFNLRPVSTRQQLLIKSQNIYSLSLLDIHNTYTWNTNAFKGATKLYFMLSSIVVIILLDTDLYQSAFSVYSFKKLVFRLSVFFVFYLFCFEFDFIFGHFSDNICVIIVDIGTKSSVVLFSPRSFQINLLFWFYINYF